MKLQYLLIFAIYACQNAYAAKTTGRISIGTTAITERFSSQEYGSDKNDELYSSQRLTYRIYELGTDQWEFATDLRNKYDMFGSLNKTQLQLDPHDEFQVRQLSAQRMALNLKWYPRIGRFQVSEAGSVFVDGVDIAYKPQSESKFGLFAGYNPKQISNPYLRSDIKSNHFGIYHNYQDKNLSWDKNFYVSHGFVEQFYDSQSSRQFLFHNLNYQWKNDSRFMSLAYIDFYPNIYIQTLNLLFQQKIQNTLNFELGALGIDVVEYQIRQNILSKINPSPYKEAFFQIEYKPSIDTSIIPYISYGQRSYDQLIRNEASLIYRLTNFISRRWDTEFKVSLLKNFTSQDSFYYWTLGYFSKNFETSLDTSYGIQKNDDGSILHPLNTEISASYFFSDALYSSISFQRAANENLVIMGTFFRIGYRFGNQKTAPIRDGAAPRGRL